jgi:phosphoesterase RecJ-like protein
MQVSAIKTKKVFKNDSIYQLLDAYLPTLKEKTLKKASKIAIMPHVSVDGDCLGSSIALAMVLEGMGKKVDVILEEKIGELPEYFSFLPGKRLLTGIDSLLEGSPEDITVYDIGLALDTGDYNRLGKRSVIFDYSMKLQ